MRLSNGGFGGKFGGTELAAEGWADEGVQSGRG